MPRDPELMTRRELAEHLSSNGYPTTLHMLNHICGRGEGPPVAGVWGGRFYYDVSKALAWARSRFRTNELSTRGRRRAA
jgi:hypothetical protein